MTHLCFLYFMMLQRDIDALANDRNHDLEKISEWAPQWKMKFDPDPSKQAQEIMFNSKKTSVKKFLSAHLSILTIHR